MGEKPSAEAAGAGKKNVSEKTTTLNPPGIGGRKVKEKNMMAGQTEQQPSQPHSQPDGSLKSLNGTDLNELLSQLQGGSKSCHKRAPA